MGADLDNLTGGAGGIDHGAAFHDGVPDRFLDVNVGSGLDGGDHRQGVPVVGGSDDGDVRLHGI